MFVCPIREGIELRLPQRRDADALFAVLDANRDHLRPWMPWEPKTKTAADVAAFIGDARRQFASENGFSAIVWVDGQPAGVVGFHLFDWDNRSTSLGYWLAKPFCDRGIMTACVERMCRWVFDELSFVRIEIRAGTENHASRAIPERLGFELEGIRRKAELVNDRWIDWAVYAKVVE